MFFAADGGESTAPPKTIDRLILVMRIIWMARWKVVAASERVLTTRNVRGTDP